MDEIANLRKFFAAPKNSTTRERIFFSRLSFDLKIAAARAGFHIHLYEPDVDRDGFDIVVEDEQGIGWYQTKAALASAGTARWEISVDFLRPSLSSAGDYAFDPVEAGRGGGVIIIEISDDRSDGHVTYRYTDFHILAAISRGYLVERKYSGRGRRAQLARDEANAIIQQLRAKSRVCIVKLSRKLFITVKTPDDLLNVMGRTGEGYAMWAVQQSFRSIEIGEDGSSDRPDEPPNTISAIHYHMGLLAKVQPDAGAKKVTLFDPFSWVGPRSEKVGSADEVG